MSNTSKKVAPGVLALLFSGGAYCLGIWLTKIYGLDPPYFYFYLGAFSQLILAPLFAISALVLFARVVVQAWKS
jgi:hypothetical protein